MGFHETSQAEHKTKGWKAALASRKTPDHLRPHLERKVAEHEAAKWEVISEEELEPTPAFSIVHEQDRPPQRGDEVDLGDGKRGTVVFSRFGVVRVKTEDGQNIRRFDWRKRR